MQHLLDAGLVRRKPSTEDRRSHTLHLTKRGRELLDAVEPAVRAAEQSLEAQLGTPLGEYRPMLEELIRAGRAAVAETSADSALD
jgi:DNA-binding MarR family transcriptional regulator